MPLNPDSAPSSSDAFLASIADLARIGLIEPYVRAVLLAEQAATVTLTPEQDVQAQQAFCQQEQIRDAAALQAYATARLLTPQALEARMRQPLQLHLLAQRQFAPARPGCVQLAPASRRRSGPRALPAYPGG
jgi:hypothetical protein